jgi:hypothetical protein
MPTEYHRKKVDNALGTGEIYAFGLKQEIVDFRLSCTALKVVAA